MGNVYKCDAKFIFQADKFILHILAEFQIQGAQRLIQKKDLRLVYNSSGDGNTLLLPAAQGVGHTVFITVQIHQLQGILYFILDV